MLWRLHYKLWKYCVHLVLTVSEMERRRRTVHRKVLEDDDNDHSDVCLSPNAVILLTLFSIFLCSLLVVVIVLAFAGGSAPDYDEEEAIGVAKRSGNEQYSLPDMAQISNWGQDGIGVMIEASKLSREHHEEYIIGYRQFSFNKYLNDRISMSRRLPDTRPDGCEDTAVDHSKMTLTASVVVVFYNEPWTMLLRTVYSIVDRSPAALLKEVILVDDGSTADWLLYPKLEHYLSVLTKVQILRLPAKVGLTKARMLGEAAMSGDVVVFLHASCECTTGWLQPLLQRIQNDNVSMAVPVVNAINADTFKYTAEPMSMTTVGSFTWDFRITKRPVKEVPTSWDERVTCPVVADGIFAVHRKTFLGLRGYDEHLEGMDAVHMELSIRTWMCSGGPIELVLCSQVGYLKPKPRSLTEDELESSYSKDRILISEKWMGDYKIFVMERLPSLPIEPAPRDRPSLSGDLQCHSFSWYLQNVEPALMLHGVISRRGKLTHMVNETVLIMAVEGTNAALVDWYVRPTTIWYLMESGQLKTMDNVCLVAKVNRKTNPIIQLGDLNVTKKEANHVHAQLQLEPKKETSGELDASQDRRHGFRKLQSYFKDLQPLEDSEKSVDNNDNHAEEAILQFRKEYAQYQENGKPDWLIPDKQSLALTSQAKSSKAQQTTIFSSHIFLPKGSRKEEGSYNIGRAQTTNKLRTVPDINVKVESCQSRFSRRNHWRFTKTGVLRHIRLNVCLSVHKGTVYELQLRKCDDMDPSQIWHFLGRNLTM
ncbi:polypeptide N-acetylgalactosaminyltransferase 13 [Biomphalaria pfeifferi]|uniref:Polypeptide N-acetylgalactosaminyltransferase n=1 Tax=Biomphalaria pfeifferi TaxID=112525 RepID=A0AAD8EUD2_BIOPF|nr:polypeptide N-acetylgalactosaminyltransferase 13 [Biomphalaria pfeifferi]